GPVWGCATHRALPPFPTRRSSDLDRPGRQAAQVLERAHHADQPVAAHPEITDVVEEDHAHRRARLDRRREQRADDGLVPTRLPRSEEHTSELQSRENLVCRLLLEN